MAGSPRLKVYDDKNRYVAAVKPEFLVAAFRMVGGQDGWTIRDGHSTTSVLWTEGGDHGSALDSYDNAAEVVWAIAAAYSSHLADLLAIN